MAAIKVQLSTGKQVEATGPDDVYSAIIDEILIPHYEESNDWEASIKTALKEVKRVVAKVGDELGVERNKSRVGLLTKVHEQLHTKIAELPGLDKIEILFLDLDDYMEDLKRIVQSKETAEEIRFEVTSLVQGLTEFELGELVVELAKLAWGK
ncbi:MAG: hypothetical protein Kow0069_28120 [Promethearchaeota archaeon]